ncbi:MAG: PAS domain S-box protein [Deltaproteobacteria bacterium]|nr:PAS domain S-box protein [Deltaproteobacteria bacterium]
MTYGDIDFKTPNCAGSEWRQSVEYKTSDGVIGGIYIVYLEQRPPEAEGPFLAEERKLLNSLSEMLRTYFERRLAEAALAFRDVILSTQQEVALDGILVVDASGNMISFNGGFAGMWGIGADIIESRSDERALQSVLEKLKDPEGFLKKVKYLYERRDQISKDEIELKDGRVFDGYSAPMSTGGIYYGRVWYFRGITERKKAEEALKESEAYAGQSIERSPIALLVDVGVNADEKIIIMNRRFTELFGYTMEDVPDVRHWRPLAYPDAEYREEVKAEWIRRVEEAIQTRSEIEPMEAAVACKDGTTRYVRAGLASLGNRNIVTFEDLTERKKYEEALKDSVERFRSITSAAMDAIVLIDHEGRVIFWNDKAEAMFGYAREEAEGKDLHALKMPERCREDYRKGYEEFKKTGRGATVGKVQELEAWNSVGIIRDITGRRQAEETLRAMVESMVGTTGRESLDRMADGLRGWLAADCVIIGEIIDDGKSARSISMTLDGKRINDYIYELKGAPCGEVFQKGFCIYPEGVSRLFPEDKALAEMNFAGYAGAPLRSSSGVTLGVLCALTRHKFKAQSDIKQIMEIMAAKAAAEIERIRAEESLNNQCQFLQLLIDTMPGPVFYKDTKGVFLGCNKAFEAFSGRPKAEIAGKTAHDIMQKDLADKYPEWDGALFDKPGVQVYEYEVADASGRRRSVIANRATFSRADGSVGGLVGTVVDITEKVEAEIKVKEEMETTSHLLMIARAASTTTDIDRLMESVVGCIHRIFGCDASLSYLWDGEAMEFIPSHAEGLTPGLASLFRGEPLGENAGFVKEALALKRKPPLSH